MNRFPVPMLALALASCSFQSSEGAASTSAAADAAGASKDAFLPDELFRRIAREYRVWGRIDGHLRFQPLACLFAPGRARIASGADAGTDSHAAKLYYLYAKDPLAYLEGIDREQPLDQIVVKESFAAVEVGADELVDRDGTPASRRQLAEKDGKLWRPGEPNGLFLIMRCAPSVPESDAGWLYATTSMDGSVVHSRGRVESCMSCHVNAPHGRLFGLQN